MPVEPPGGANDLCVPELKISATLSHGQIGGAARRCLLLSTRREYELRSNFGATTPKHQGKPGTIRDQKTKPGITIDDPVRSAKPPSPVQIRAAPPFSSGRSTVCVPSDANTRLPIGLRVDYIDSRRQSGHCRKPLIPPNLRIAEAEKEGGSGNICFLVGGGSRLTHHNAMGLALPSPHYRAGAPRCAIAQAHPPASWLMCRSPLRRLAGNSSRCESDVLRLHVRKDPESDGLRQPENGICALKPASTAGRRYPPSRPAMTRR